MKKTLTLVLIASMIMAGCGEKHPHINVSVADTAGTSLVQNEEPQFKMKY